MDTEEYSDYSPNDGSSCMNILDTSPLLKTELDYVATLNYKQEFATNALEEQMEGSDEEKEKTCSDVLSTEISQEHSEGIFSQCESCLKYLTKGSSFANQDASSSEDKSYLCAQCDASKVKFEKGSSSQNPSRPFVCTICKRGFAFEKTLLRHTERHKEFYCDKCCRAFMTKTNLSRHMRNVHSKGKIFICQICSLSLEDLNGLEEHSKTHAADISQTEALQTTLDVASSSENFRCDICELNFTSKVNLNKHIKMHSVLKPYKCHFGNCFKRFSCRSALLQHEKIHTGEKNYECPDCKQKFRSKSNLTDHSSIHNGILPYQCDLCEKRFRSTSNLTQHRRHHFDLKPHACKICSKSFATNAYLRMHVKIHTGEKSHVCQKCEKSFRTKYMLRSHMMLMHTQECICEECGERFTDKILLKQHRAEHKVDQKYECDVCEKCYKYKCALSRHKKLHDGK